ncbi:BLOC-2 complex member HPS6 [Ambystoma mexicanum]|uniref:BLOC-2 complex member HPS6 n=1 Tax=Ambystoma mexicanum TaxID=8296 RepID=UPI0037E9AF13
MSQDGGPPRRVSDLEDFARPQELREALQGAWGCGGEVRGSPDGQHLLLLHRERRLLQAYDRISLPAAPHRPQGRLHRSWTPLQPSVAGLVFVEGPGSAWMLAVVSENGHTEVWGYRAEEGGWAQRQSLELCNSPRARVVSVCCYKQSLVWCEERAPSGTTLASCGATTLGFCVCHRDWEFRGPQLNLGPMKIVLHHSPQYQLLASPHHIYLIPSNAAALGRVSKTLLVWIPTESKVVVVALSIGAILCKSLALADSDFKNLMFECLALLPSIDSAEVQSVALSSCGGLLLMTQRGVISLLHPRGTLRQVYDFERQIAPEEHIQMQIFDNTLACALCGALYLIDVNIGRLREKIIMSTNKILLMPSCKESAFQYLTPTGMYEVILTRKTGGLSGSETALVQMVFEEACKYYQQRSLGNTKLTVESLKQGAMFQAPIALSSILQDHHRDKAVSDSQGPYRKLLHTINAELETFLDLEHLKSCLVGLSGAATEQYYENLVDQEIIRLLNSGLDRENIVYVNYLFKTFPQAFWKSISRCLQLQQNGVGHSIDIALPDVWKKVLVPTPSVAQDGTLNGVVPLFELICQSLYSYKPKGLASFVAKAQQYVGVHWNYGNGCEVSPLYKRAMAVLKDRRFNTTPIDGTDIEVELLLCSERPTAVNQAVDLLINQKSWRKVLDVAEKYSPMSPCVHKHIFTSLLIEFARHRELDPFLDQLWELCPEEMTATDILNIVLQHITISEDNLGPFSCNSSGQVTVGLLKPLLNKVLQFRVRSDELYDGSPETLSFPPQTPPREHRTIPKAGTEPRVRHERLKGRTSSVQDAFTGYAQKLVP